MGGAFQTNIRREIAAVAGEDTEQVQGCEGENGAGLGLWGRKWSRFRVVGEETEQV
jgi:hypothetical protein